MKHNKKRRLSQELVAKLHEAIVASAESGQGMNDLAIRIRATEIIAADALHKSIPPLSQLLH